MLLINGDVDPGGRPAPTSRGTAREMSWKLHQLALRYWAEGRGHDARRVAAEAARLLRGADPDSELMTQITSTIEDLRLEPSGGP